MSQRDKTSISGIFPAHPSGDDASTEAAHKKIALLRGELNELEERVSGKHRRAVTPPDGIGLQPIFHQSDIMRGFPAAVITAHHQTMAITSANPKALEMLGDFTLYASSLAHIVLDRLDIPSSGSGSEPLPGGLKPGYRMCQEIKNQARARTANPSASEYLVLNSYVHGPIDVMVTIGQVDDVEGKPWLQLVMQEVRPVVDASQRDHLTGLLNKKILETVLEREIIRRDRPFRTEIRKGRERLEREAKASRGPNAEIPKGLLEQMIRETVAGLPPLSILMVDIDHFKTKVNDVHGHPAGDEVIKAVARHIKQCVRCEVDVAVRAGGEEFAVVLVDTDLVGAEQVAERIRQDIASAPVSAIDLSGRQVLIPVTVSIGAAALDVADLVVSPKVTTPAANLRRRVDAALYDAKGRPDEPPGRNRVRLSSSQMRAVG
jgi:diguanylate cyclase (GGDEF)-like protein